MKYCPKCGFDIQSFNGEGQNETNYCPECRYPFKQAADGSLLKNSGNKSEIDFVQMIREKKYIQAVAEYRIQNRVGLKEAKSRIDELARQNNLSITDEGSGARTRFWVYLFLSLFLGLMAASVGIAVFPETGLISKPLFGGDLTIESAELYTPAGQAGTTSGKSRSFYSGGEQVSLQVFVYSALLYSLIFFIFFYMRHIIRQRKKEALG